MTEVYTAPFVVGEMLIEAGNALARALGHHQGCPKISPALPCTCGEGAKQAKALDDWQQLIYRLTHNPS